MFRLSYILLGCLLCPFWVDGQTHTVKSSPIISFLYNYNKPIVSITNTENIGLFDINIANHTHSYKKLIKTKSGLYILFDGTGQVYRATNLKDDNIEFTRIDSTWHFGNNYFAINFGYLDTLYSFGGYGFWHTNGQLRHFDYASHEWHINKINKLLNTNDFHYHNCLNEEDSLNQPTIYYITGPINTEEVISNDNNYSAVKFNLSTKENSILGKINDKIILRNAPFLDLTSLHGVLVNTLRDYYLLKFESNEVYKLNNYKIVDLLNSNSLKTTFMIKDRLYYTTINDNHVQYTSIDLNDFKKEPYPLYYIENATVKYWYLFIEDWYILILASIILIIGITYYKSAKYRKLNYEKQFIQDLTQDGTNNSFNSLEKSIIEKIIERTNQKSVFTVDEMNLHLGIKKKTIEIQKKVRNESINRINHKFNVNFDMDTVFIERTRSSDDRRFFNYIINADNAKIYFTIKNPAEN